MKDGSQPIPPKDWETIIENVPIVSVDIVIEHDGGVVLGKRENEPAKDEWFVPGGTVLKNEQRTEAVHRVAAEELGESIVIDEMLGVYEHFYDAAEVEGVDSKHYLATAYSCSFEHDDPKIASDSQHEFIKVFHPPFGKFHPYVSKYLELVGNQLSR